MLMTLRNRTKTRPRPKDQRRANGTISSADMHTRALLHGGELNFNPRTSKRESSGPPIGFSNLINESLK